MREEYRKELMDIFGDRVSFDQNDCRIYSHDVSVMPRVFGIDFNKLVCKIPEAVVQPVSVEEVVSLVKFARKYRIPLTPRGAATSGVAGPVPAKGGIVVDFLLMKKIISIDEETAFVEAGVVWKDLEEELTRRGLALRCYPSSAPSSTVAGWVAAGGIGIGSFEYGSIKDNVVSVEIVLPDGEVREMDGDLLELINECNGITGLITKVRIKVKTYEEIVPFVACFFTLEEMTGALSVFRRLPLWNLGFETSEFVGLKQNVKGEKTEEMHLVVAALPERRYEQLKGNLEKIVLDHNGEIMSRETAEEEWEERFYPLRIKKLGPSIVVGEVYLPQKELRSFLEFMGKKIRRRTFGMEGTFANKEEAAVRCWILEDERSFFGVGYSLAWSIPLLFLKKAKKFGGRTYQVGVYLSKEAKNYFGDERLKKLRDFKREVDPLNLMNPNKIFSSKKIRAVFGFGIPLMSFGYRLWPSYKCAVPLQKDVYSCARCSYCRNVCTMYREIGWESSSPRGKMHFAREYLRGMTVPTQKIVERIHKCTACGYCSEVCQAMLPVVDLWEDLRADLIEHGYGPMEAHLRIRDFTERNNNPFGEPHDKRDAWIPDISYKHDGELAFFAGCTASYRMQHHARNTVEILRKAGVDFVYLAQDEFCCGSPFLRTGQRDLARKLIAHNIKEINSRGINKLVLSCAGCSMTFSNSYPEWAEKLGMLSALEWNVEVLHISQFILELLQDGKIRLKEPIEKTVTYHDPCHIGRHLKIYEEPRDVLRSIPGIKLVEMENNRERARCCGAGGGVRAAFPDLANSIAYKRILEAKNTGAEIIVSCCPFCELSFKLINKEKNLGLQIKNITELVVESSRTI